MFRERISAGNSVLSYLLQCTTIEDCNTAEHGETWVDRSGSKNCSNSGHQCIIWSSSVHQHCGDSSQAGSPIIWCHGRPLPSNLSQSQEHDETHWNGWNDLWSHRYNIPNEAVGIAILKHQKRNQRKTDHHHLGWYLDTSPSRHLLLYSLGCMTLLAPWTAVFISSTNTQLLDTASKKEESWVREMMIRCNDLTLGCQTSDSWSSSKFHHWP